MKNLMIFPIIAFIVLFSVGWDLGSWTGTTVTDPEQAGNNPVIVPDGSGGAIVFWIVSGSNTIKAQRFDAYGVRLWGSSGISIMTISPPGSNIKAVSDGSGGAIVVWNASVGGTNLNVYSAKINSSGTISWQNTAIGSSFNESLEDISPDGSGGVLITCLRYSGGSPWVYAQRVNNSGSVLWGAGGVQVSSTPIWQENADISSDDSGGAYIVWVQTDINGRSSVWANRLNSSGNPIAGFHKVIVYSRSGEQFRFPKTVADGYSGIWIAYSRGMSDSSMDLYANKYTNTAFVHSTLTLCTASDQQVPVELVTDNSHGAILVWEDKRDYATNEKDIYTILIREGGIVSWGSNGMVVANDIDNEDQPAIYPDGSGGAIYVWRKDSGSGTDIYTNLILSDGSYQWGGSIALCDALNSQAQPVVTATGTGNFIGAWADNRSSSGSVVYAQYICLNGTIGNCDAGIPISIFTAIPDSGTFPLDVFFNGSASYDNDGTIVSWFWDFGDGNTGTGVIINHTFQNVGIYTVQLTVEDNMGLTATSHKQIKVTLGEPPVAIIDAYPVFGLPPLMVNFDGSKSYDPDGNITKYNWEFGDGFNASGETVSHTYNNVGFYTAKLRIKDNNGNIGRDAVNISVIDYNDLRIEIYLNPAIVKANGRGQIEISASVYKGSSSTEIATAQQWELLLTDIGLDFELSNGTLHDNRQFSSSTGVYKQSLSSGIPGTAEIRAVLDQTVMSIAVAQYRWPLPPVNLNIEFFKNRSLFKSELYGVLRWSVNPDEFFKIAKYRIYRSIDGGSFEIIDEVNSSTFDYIDRGLKENSVYTYKISAVDSEGDESKL